MSGRGYKNTPQMDANLDLVAHGNHPSQLRLNFADEAAAQRQQKYRDFVQCGINTNDRMAYFNTQRAEKLCTSLKNGQEQQSLPASYHPQELHVPFQHTPAVIGNNNTTNSTVVIPVRTGTRDFPVVIDNDNTFNVDTIFHVSRPGETRDSPIIIDESNNRVIKLQDLTRDSTTTIDNEGADLCNDQYPYSLRNYIKIMGRNHETDALEKAITKGKISASNNNAFKTEGKDQMLNPINYEELLYENDPFNAGLPTDMDPLIPSAQTLRERKA